MDQSGHAGDSLVFVNTFDGCADVSQNRVIALYASTLKPAWVFNADSSYQVGPFSAACTLSIANNRLYCATATPDAISNTIFALDTTSAGPAAYPLWSGNVGYVAGSVAIGTDGTRLYVNGGNNFPSLYALDANGDGQGGLKAFWSLAYQYQQFDAVIGTRPQSAERIFFAPLAFRGQLCGVEDEGNFGQTLDCYSSIGREFRSATATTSTPVFFRGGAKLYLAGDLGFTSVIGLGYPQFPLVSATDEVDAGSLGQFKASVIGTDSTIVGGPPDRLMVSGGGTVSRYPYPFPQDVPFELYTSDIFLAMTGPDTVNPGQAFTYLLTVTNMGPDWATDVSVVDNVPLGMSDGAALSQGRFQINFPPLGNQFVARLGDMAPNSTAVITIPVTAPHFAGTVITNTALATAGEIDNNPDNNKASVTTVVVGADLAIAMTASPSPVVAGSNVTYQITVSNRGTDPADSVVVTDSLSALYTFVSCYSTAGGICGGGNNNLTVTFTSLPAGAKAVITLMATVSPGTPNNTYIPNTANAGFAKPDPSPEDNSAIVNLQVLGRPAISAQISGKSSIGSSETLSLTLTNTGTGAAQSFVLAHVVPHTLVGTVSVTYTNPVLPVPVVNLAPGASVTISLSLIVPEAVKKYSLLEEGTLQDSLGNHYSFSASQVVFP